MVIKLIKHDLIRAARMAAVPVIAMFCAVILARLSLIGNTNDGSEGIIFMFSFIFYIITACFTSLFCLWAGVSRFYSTIFTREGYMTLSLPVTADELVFSKLVSAIITFICGCIVCALSWFVLFIGRGMEDALLALLDTLAALFSPYYAEVSGLFIFELVMLYLLSIPGFFLVMFTLMSVGQLATVKNRIVITVVLCIGLSWAWGALYSAALGEALIKLGDISPHLAMWVQIIFIAAVDAACYLITRYIIKNKVNLIA